MADGKRVLNLPTKRFPLADVGPGWEDAYLDYLPLTPRDLLKLQGMDPKTMTEADSTNFMLELAKTHVTGGKVSVLENGQTKLVDALAEDVELLSVDILTDLFSTMSGASADPKDTETDQAASSEQSNDSVPTEVPLSKGSEGSIQSSPKS